jgi:hypothetical protein
MRTYQFALVAIFLLEHLDIWVFWQAFFTHRGEVGGLVSGTVEVLLDLRRHLGGRKSGGA